MLAIGNALQVAAAVLSWRGMDAPALISTPCLKICAVDGRSGLCVGCGRTLKEIAEWGALSEPQRLAVMDELPGRMARLDERR